MLPIDLLFLKLSGSLLNSLIDLRIKLFFTYISYIYIKAACANSQSDAIIYFLRYDVPYKFHVMCHLSKFLMCH